MPHLLSRIPRGGHNYELLAQAIAFQQALQWSSLQRIQLFDCLPI
jgi:hypothetical protein